VPWQSQIMSEPFSFKDTIPSAMAAIKSPFFMVVIFLSSVLPLSSNKLSSFLGIAKIVDSFRPWIGGATLFSGVALIVHVVVYLKSRYEINQLVKERIWRLNHLAEDEREIFRRMIIENRKTIILSMSKGVAGSLEAQQMIFRSSHLSRRNDEFPYTIQPVVWKYLQDHFECLGLTKETLLNARNTLNQPRIYDHLTSAGDDWVEGGDEGPVR